ncbi:hypothetical protein UA75_01820 [Actinoalloteichus sp. GBA129-24]|uniref:Uncharacterized protein n=1 Tax=Actinoalloteichus fjordicus TaxID=1612552 RepID=A0AAC9L7R6_9PSEU|nr:hypothetical protein UA74_01815 [Actinoalloteichus fjordicus]APU18404.1 hypothetical protein UA75_01820 [Actinoalloteichus sp. GBA129-24]
MSYVGVPSLRAVGHIVGRRVRHAHPARPRHAGHVRRRPTRPSESSVTRAHGNTSADLCVSHRSLAWRPVLSELSITTSSRRSKRVQGHHRPPATGAASTPMTWAAPRAHGRAIRRTRRPRSVATGHRIPSRRRIPSTHSPQVDVDRESLFPAEAATTAV